MPKIKVAESGILPQGHYEGTIESQLLRKSEFTDDQGKAVEATYLDLYIVPDVNPEITLRPGYNFELKEGSMLHNLLMRFGATKKDLKVGSTVTTEDIIPDGTRCQFTIVRQRTKNRRTQEEQEFSNIVRDTVSPLDEQED